MKEIPNLCNDKTYDKPIQNRKKSSDASPFFAPSFFINGVNSGAAWVVQQTKQHEIYSSEGSPSSHLQYRCDFVIRSFK